MDFTQTRPSSTEVQVGEDVDSLGSSPSFSSLSSYLLLLSHIARKLRVASIPSWIDGCLQMEHNTSIYSSPWLVLAGCTCREWWMSVGGVVTSVNLLGRRLTLHFYHLAIERQRDLLESVGRCPMWFGGVPTHTLANMDGSLDATLACLIDILSQCKDLWFILSCVQSFVMV